MSTVLLYMDQNITVRLVNSKAHKLKKGYGLHADMAAIAALTAVCSLLGLPWLVAATVRSLAHVKALANYEQQADGTEVIASMTETRVSGFAVHAAIGAAILYLRPALSRVPLAVLMGLFLYLGAGGLKGNQLFDRVKLLITDPKLRPQVPWVTQVLECVCLYVCSVMISHPVRQHTLRTGMHSSADPHDCKNLCMLLHLLR